MFRCYASKRARISSSHDLSCHSVGEVHVAYIGDEHQVEDENNGHYSISLREARKRFQQFLRTETRSLGSHEPYSAQLMRQQGSHRTVDVDIKDLKKYDGVLGQQLEEKPNTFLPLVRCVRLGM
jgi:hypothetical protein